MSPFDSESELSDLPEDFTNAEDFYNIDSGQEGEALDSSSEESEYALPNQTSKEGKNKKSNTKRKAGESKSQNGKGKKKAKRSIDVDDDDEEEDDIGAEVNKKDKARKKKVIVAQEARWTDIPVWGDRQDSPLLELPLEILDKCFGLSTGLELRDYLAMAGVCRWFRTQLDYKFFEAALVHRGDKYAREEVTSALSRYGRTPFTNTVQDWRKDKEHIALVPTHYIPPGERSTWTEAQYIVYCEEKARWRAAEKDKRRAKLQEAEKSAQDLVKNRGVHIDINHRNRRVQAEILGRLDGEPPITKNEWGLPIKDLDPVKTEASAASESSSDLGSQIARESITPAFESCEDESRKKLGRISSVSRADNWTVPETDEESDFEEIPKFDNKGKPVPHDYWPCYSRNEAAKVVNGKYINKTEAMNTFFVKDVELITLRHYLVSNPMSRRQPQQAFLKAAVQALAYRSHGGPIGHELHVTRINDRSTSLAQAREARIEKAKADGTYVPKPNKRCKALPFDYYFDYDNFTGFCKYCRSYH